MGHKVKTNTTNSDHKIDHKSLDSNKQTSTVVFDPSFWFVALINQWIVKIGSISLAMPKMDKYILLDIEGVPVEDETVAKCNWFLNVIICGGKRERSYFHNLFIYQKMINVDCSMQHMISVLSV